MPISDNARNGLSTAADGSVLVDRGDGYTAVVRRPARGATASNSRNLPATTQVQASPPTDPTAVMYDHRTSNGTGKITIPKDDRPPYYFRMGIAEYRRDGWLRVGQLTPTLTVELPIPQSLLDAHSTLWQAEEIGLTGALTMSALGGFKDSGAGGPIRSLARGAIAGLAGIGGALGAATGTGFGAGAQASIGWAVNNYMTMMLQGPAYKKHEFKWKVSPDTAAESEELVRLYREINNAQAVGLSPTLGSTFFTYPKIFQLEFVHEEADMGKMLYRFKPCVLKTSAWNFMPMGAAFYGETHAPESVEFSFEFVELEFWLTGDFR